MLDSFFGCQIVLATLGSREDTFWWQVAKDDQLTAYF